MAEEMESQANVGVENQDGRPKEVNHISEEHGIYHEKGITTNPYEFIPKAPEEVKPVVGKVFTSVHDTYNFYNVYARWCGFSIRKGSTQNSMKTSETIMRTFTCSKEGHRDSKYTEAVDHKRRLRGMSKCNCKAKIVVCKKGQEIWEVKTFVEEHNHTLMSPNKNFLFRIWGRESLQSQA